MRRITVALIAFTFLFLGAPRLFAYPTYPANSGVAKVGPNDTAFVGSANLNDGGGLTGRWFFTYGHQYRIRQNGTVSQVKVYIPPATAITTLKIQIWRFDGSSFDLVGESENIASGLTTSQTNTVTLSSPITGVQEGDYYAYQVDASGTGQNVLATRTSVSGVTTYYSESEPTSSNFTWTSQTAVAGSVVPIELFMTPPQVVFIGDSIIAGHNNHYSYIESLAVSDTTSTIEYQFSTLAGGRSYQNYGIGSQTTANISARFSDVLALNPAVVVIEGGVNDIANSVSQSTFIANMTSMLDAAQADSNVRVVYVFKILPWTNGTTVQMQTRDTWNAALETLVDGYSKAHIVDASSYVGEFRAGGDVGNLWDMQAAYDEDGVHYTAAGHGQIAQALIDAADAEAPTITSITASNANGNYTLGQDIDITVTFSEPVITTGSVTLTFETGATDRTCTFSVTYASTGTCTYTVQSGDTSADLQVSNVSGTVNDSSGNTLVNFTPTTNLAANKDLAISNDPKIITIDSANADGTYYVGESIDIDFTFSEAITSTGYVTVTLETGTTDNTCRFKVTNASSATCTYIVHIGDIVEDLTVNSVSGTVVDGSGNGFLPFAPESNLAESNAFVLRGFPEYTPNVGYSKVAPYDTISTASPNISDGGGGRSFINVSNRHRIRQNGTVTRVRFYITAGGGTVNTFKVSIWRKDGSTYDMVGESENFAASITTGTTNTITLGTPITGVQEGDYIAFSYDTSGAGNNLRTQTLTGAQVYYKSGMITTTTNYDWAAQSALSAGSSLPVEVYMDPAEVVMIGDGVISGSSTHNSYLGTTALDDITSTLEAQLASKTGFDYQNMGISTNTVASVAARIAADAINLDPIIPIVHAGTADIATTTTESAFTTSMTSIVSAAQSDADIQRIIVVETLPRDDVSATNARMQVRDTWNASLRALRSTYSKLRVVNASSYVGEFRSGGDVGNLWDIQAAYSSDGVNFNSAGKEKIAQAILDYGLQNPRIVSIDTGSGDGTFELGETLTFTFTFSEALTSTGSMTATFETGTTDRTCTFSVSSATSATCDYTVQADDTSADLNVTSITGTLGNTYETLSDLDPILPLSYNRDIVIDGSSSTPGITISESSGSTSVAESATTDTFTVVLDAEPVSDVVLNVSSGDTGEATVSPSTLTFTNANWDTPQTVTVTGVNDDLVDGSQNTTITISVNDGSSSNEYDAVADETVSATTTDNDTAGVTITESSGSTTVSESGTTDSFTVVLDAEPVSDVVLNVSSGDTGEATVSPSTLTFTNANWDTPQTVTVTGVNDAIVDDSQITTVTVAVVDGSSSNEYDAVADETVSVTTTDNETAGFTITESGGTTSVLESGTTDTFTTVLNTEPLSDVVISVSSGDTGEATVSPSTLTFTNANWDTPQTVTVTGVPDLLADGTQNATITLSIVDGSSSNEYDALADQTVTASVGDTTDVGAPTRSDGAPSGSIAFGTLTTDITLTTNEAATCKYDTTAGVAYGAMASTFTTTGGTSHSETVSGLTTGSTYTYYVRCVDGASNANSDDYTISFSVSAQQASSGGSSGSSPSLRARAQNNSVSSSLSYGASGLAVKALQQKLNSKNFLVAFSGPGSRGLETTFFGPATRAALLKFQAAKGLPQTGVVDAATQAALGSSDVSPLPSPLIFTRNLSLNTIHPDVKKLQQFLNANGYVLASTGPGAPGKETTIFGPVTKTAVMKFQTNNGIPATGYVGPLTRTRINILMSAQ